MKLSLKKVLKYTAGFIAAIVLLVIGLWVGLSFIVAKKLSAQDPTSPVQVQIPKKLQTPGATPGRPGSPGSPEAPATLTEPPALKDELRDYASLKQNKLMLGYVMSRSVLGAAEVMKTRHPENFRPFCALVCDPPLSDEKTADQQGPLYYEDFLNETGERAFEDYQYRLGLQMQMLMYDLIGDELLRKTTQLIEARLQGAQVAPTTVMRLGYLMARAGVKMKSFENEFDLLGKDIKTLEELPKSCAQKSLTEIQDNCEKLQEKMQIFKMKLAGEEK